ncbi:MAG TPA: hypothetical protein VG848_14885 [Acetobacteraceae bacterium]|nr:hypothetical protein [Acetobacteraceae bacterium]
MANIVSISDGQTMPRRGLQRFLGRLLLLVLTGWALATILPELYRVAEPLSAFGLSADNDGVILDVIAPFASARESPAARAGLVAGERLDLAHMRCTVPTSPACASLVVLLGGLGGMQYTRPGRSITLVILPPHAGPPRLVRLTAVPAPLGWPARLVLLADTVVGALFIAVAFHLVWTRPSRMTWGFFLYAIWFNPGQTYAFYALIQPWPPLLLAEQFLEALAQGAAYAGFFAFTFRFPTAEPDPFWRRLEPALPWLGAAIALLMLLCAGNLFGFQTERITDAVFLAGYGLDFAAILVLLLRLRTLNPQDEQRMRWAIAGCVIGLPAFIFAEISQSSGLLYDLWGALPSQVAIGLLYLFHGVIAYFVGTAVRRRRVVSVAIPLRRGAVLTAFTLALGVPILYLHEALASYRAGLDLPGWIWALIVGPISLLVLTRMHELSVDIADHACNRRYHRAREELRVAGEAILRGKDFATIDRLLAEVPTEALRLSSAAVFRWIDGAFRRTRPSIGWAENGLVTLDRQQDAQIFASLARGVPLALPRGQWRRPGLPADDQAPCLAVPVRGGEVEGIAVALFGPHLSGSDVNADERALLGEFAARAAFGYERAEIERLRNEVSALRALLRTAPS